MVIQSLISSFVCCREESRVERVQNLEKGDSSGLLKLGRSFAPPLSLLPHHAPPSRPRPPSNRAKQHSHRPLASRGSYKAIRTANGALSPPPRAWATVSRRTPAEQEQENQFRTAQRTQWDMDLLMQTGEQMSSPTDQQAPNPTSTDEPDFFSRRPSQLYSVWLLQRCNLIPTRGDMSCFTTVTVSTPALQRSESPRAETRLSPSQATNSSAGCRPTLACGLKWRIYFVALGRPSPK